MQASSIYIASPEGDTAKWTIALGILHQLTATVARVGVFRPITRLGEVRDYIPELLLAQTRVCKLNGVTPEKEGEHCD